MKTIKELTLQLTHSTLKEVFQSLKNMKTNNPTNVKVVRRQTDVPTKSKELNSKTTFLALLKFHVFAKTHADHQTGLLKDLIFFYN